MLRITFFIDILFEGIKCFNNFCLVIVQQNETVSYKNVVFVCVS